MEREELIKKLEEIAHDLRIGRKMISGLIDYDDEYVSTIANTVYDVIEESREKLYEIVEKIRCEK